MCDQDHFDEDRKEYEARDLVTRKAEAGGATPLQQVMPLACALNETTHMADAKAFVRWLDRQTPHSMAAGL
ncbi:hypothetical protein SBA3_660008 [Candidatus Sulfopaludibacter sp. SbA3]|nr:hypothetical protein SBA3_660008 [Candidatus Sulfopaludibacter sp. SbA3]